MDLITLELAKRYVDKALAGLGALKGKDGDSAYDIAKKHGFDGTEDAWLASLKEKTACLLPSGRTAIGFLVT